ncbi:hypothetical protein Celaphus_00015678, partial [Cervus elaphus hippelaphus]
MSFLNMQNYFNHLLWESHQIQNQKVKPESTLETLVNHDMNIGGFHTFFENLNSMTITLTTSSSEGIQKPLETEEMLETTTNYLANSQLQMILWKLKQQILGKLKSLEALIRQLKQENWLSEENYRKPFHN